MNWMPWSFETEERFTLRGWHTPPSGKPLVHFLHGNGFCGRVYEPMLKLLAGRVDLWLSDVQGHGDSDNVGRFVGWNRSARLAIAALDAHRGLFGPVPLLALGHSFGGVLTCLALGDEPGRFARAVVLDPVIFPPAMLMAVGAAHFMGLSRHNELARKTRTRRRHWPDREAALASLQWRGAYKGWSPQAMRAFVEHALRPAEDGGVELKCDPSLEAHIFSSSPDRLWPTLNAITTPTTVLYASDTFPFVEAGARHLQLINRHVRLRQVKGGHCFMQEDPPAAARLVLEHLLTPLE